ncbi:MAG TPA: LacI family transcriptional regulator [Firmicutes bacterium]|nr:LacI family transcriptional regulator [Bacillota bacterium]
MKYTIRDVAKKAGVSIATVSRVLNNKDRVKEETRQKVLSVIEELNYVTNFSAKALRKNQTDVIGAIVPEIANSFYGEIIQGIENKANEYDLRLIVCDGGGKLEKELDFVRFLYDKSISGMIFILPSLSDDELVKIKKSGKPIVLFGRNMQAYNIPSITVDNKRGAYKAVMHLVSHGYKKIAYISGDEAPHLPDRKERLDGYRAALQECGYEIKPEYIAGGPTQTISTVFTHLMELPEPPDAIFCAYDELALGVLKTAQQMGVKIPDDVALVGFDDLRICQYTSPPLTTVKQPTYMIGNLCCEKLIYTLDQNNEVPSVNLVIPPQLIVRESCGC